MTRVWNKSDLELMKDTSYLNFMGEPGGPIVLAVLVTMGTNCTFRVNVLCKFYRRSGWICVSFIRWTHQKARKLSYEWDNKCSKDDINYGHKLNHGVIFPWPVTSFMHCGLTHWGRDNMAAIFQTTFSNRFSWKKMYEFWLTFHWSLFLGVQLTIFQHWFR